MITIEEYRLMKKTYSDPVWRFTADVVFPNKNYALNVLSDRRKQSPEVEFKLVMREISEWKDV